MHQPPFTTEPLEARLLLTKATDAAIEKFNLSPAVFVENDGQWTDSSVRFVHQGKGASIAMTDRGPVFELYRDVTPVDSFVVDDQLDSRFDDPVERSIESTRFSVSFQNSNITTPIGHDRSSSTFNYNIGTPDLHRSNVHGFERIVYPDLYTGIDLHTWGQRDSLKYEFHVAPNIDYRQIKVQYEGVEDLWIDDRGRLHAKLGNGFGEVIDDSPVIWQEVKGKRVDVAGKFKLLNGDAGGDAYTFELTGKFDPKLPLVIDPDLAWGTYLGGTSAEPASGITTDSAGNIYVTGWTTSSGWVSGGLDSSLDGNIDAYVVKVNAAGEHIWSTYLGGTSIDYGFCIATDSGGNVYVAGETRSSGWLNGGFDTTLDGISDAYVVKLSAAGEHLWSTYLGGSEGEQARAIASDTAGNAYVSGYTRSPDWVSGGFDTSHNSSGSYDAFVVKLNASGNHLWSTYSGGESIDSSYGLATDLAGDVYMTGRTTSSDWISGGFDTSYNGGTSLGGDAFVVKLTSTGEHLWSTYLGGTTNDIGYGIATDTTGNVYVTGSTLSPGWVSGGYDTSLNGGFYDAFVVKLSTSGAHLWSTYVGGTTTDGSHGIAINFSGDVYITGSTSSSDWVSGGFDTSQNGEGDAFVAKLSASGNHVWSTYLGGADSEDGYAITTDSTGNIYAMGTTYSSGWVSGGYDTILNGEDTFVVKISDVADITVPVFNGAVHNYLTTSQQTLTATFNENISASLAAADFVLTNLNTTTNIPLTLQSISADGQSATFTFSATGNDLGGAILTDGHYRIRALAGQIEDESGNALASDVDHFFDFKNADVAMEDHIVDFSDLLVVAQNYGITSATFADGDVNYDGEVNFNDLLAVAQRYGTGIPELRIGRVDPASIKSKSIIGDVYSADTRIV